VFFRGGVVLRRRPVCLLWRGASCLLVLRYRVQYFLLINLSSCFPLLSFKAENFIIRGCKGNETVINRKCNNFP
jgi:hypothetical protein